MNKMKKYLCMMAAAAAVAAVTPSCSNEDIVISTVAPSHGVSYSVSTPNMYEQIDVVDNVETLMERYSSINLEISTFVYDADGNLVDESVSSLRQFDTVTKQYTLPEGDYTFVTIEKLDDPAEANMTKKWEITGTETLNSLQIGYPEYQDHTYWYNAIGTVATKVSVREDAVIDVAPSVVGSLATINYCRYDKSPYIKVGFGVVDAVMGIRLDPSLSADEKYVRDLTQEGYFVNRSILDVDDNDFLTQTIYILDNEIRWEFATQTQENYDNNDIWGLWPSEGGTIKLADGSKHYFSTFYLAPEYPVVTNVSNTFDEFTNWYGSMMSQVPSSGLIPNVCIEWASSVAYVQDWMKNGFADFTLAVGEEGAAKLQSSGLYALAYNGDAELKQIQYFFREEATDLVRTTLVYDAAQVNEADVVAELEETYLLFMQDDGVSYFSSYDLGTWITVATSSNGNYVNVLYYDYEYLSGARSGSRASEDELKAKISSETKKCIMQ